MKPRIAMMLATASLAITAAALPAVADTILDTGVPDGGWFGFTGYDLSPEQSVGIAFTTSTAYTLDGIGMWMMSNDWDNPGRIYTVTLRTGVPGSNNGIPGNDIIESWTTATAAVGWTPVLEQLNSTLHPVLTPGTQYWVVAESAEPGGSDPLWTWGSSWDPQVVGINNIYNPEGWVSGEQSGSAPGVVISGTVVPAPAAAAALGMVLCARRRRR